MPNPIGLRKALAGADAPADKQELIELFWRGAGGEFAVRSLGETVEVARKFIGGPLDRLIGRAFTSSA